MCVEIKMWEVLRFQVLDLTCRKASVCLLRNLPQVSVIKYIKGRCVKIIHQIIKQQEVNHKHFTENRSRSDLDVVHGQLTVKNELPHIFISSVNKNLGGSAGNTKESRNCFSVILIVHLHVHKDKLQTNKED